MSINLSYPVTHELKPKISVIGVGGAGGNAVNNMIASHLEGVEFVACNTDAQALANCLTDRKIQLGHSITHGLGAGARPEVGSASAEESLDEILEQLEGSNMVFITAGMGGGTGTGAAPVIARAVRAQGILTVGVVTKPFHFEGAHRMRLAEGGLAELQEYVDTLIVIPNQNLFRLANERTTFGDAFKMADQVLHMGVRGVTDLMIMPGLINLDFADIRTVMSEMGKAMMGTGEAEGEKRAIEAAEAAISNPLLDEVSMRGARGVLINITGGSDITLFEVDAAANRVREEVDADANIIFGSTYDESMQGSLRVSVVATGIESPIERRQAVEKVDLSDEPAAAPAAQSSGWFPKQVHKQAPYPTTVEGAARQRAPVMASNPTAHLRAADMGRQPEVASRQPSFVPPPAESPAFVRDAQRPSEERAPSIFDRVKGLAFPRNGAHQPSAEPQARRVPHSRIDSRPEPRPDSRPVDAPRQEDTSDVPAFLRRVREDA
ncbi:MAG: cell division protein FtsZ [Geminicoccaceae bacterium]|nr:cell division protein FtsZ [Geminicoccaceae bacterium]